MKLIIDIPEETVKNCKSVNWSNIRYEQVDDMELAIANGIPLEQIRAEIIDKYMTATGEVNTVAKGCLQIIDKYKAESEDKK